MRPRATPLGYRAFSQRSPRTPRRVRDPSLGLPQPSSRREPASHGPPPGTQGPFEVTKPSRAARVPSLPASRIPMVRETPPPAARRSLSRSRAPRFTTRSSTPAPTPTESSAYTLSLNMCFTSLRLQKGSLGRQLSSFLPTPHRRFTASESPTPRTSHAGSGPTVHRSIAVPPQPRTQPSTPRRKT